MPTYGFRCPEGHEFDKFYRKMSDAASELACPTCGALAARQLHGGVGLHFKGSGFYLTDYGKNAHRSSGSAAPKGGGDGTGGGEGKSSGGGEGKGSSGGEGKSSSGGEGKGGAGSGSSGGSSGGSSSSGGA